MNIHDKAVKNMIEGYQLIGIQSFDESSVVHIVRTCEICGGSTESLDNHICEYCRESIRKLFRENRCVDEVDTEHEAYQDEMGGMAEVIASEVE